MLGRVPTLRLAALIASAALAVHELRFLIAPVDGGTPSGGHAYLGQLGAVLAIGVALACAQLVGRIARARSGRPVDERAIGLGALWLTASVAIVVIFAGQELLEGALAAGRSSGLHGVVGDGGWVALPLALALGLLVAVGARGARALVLAAGRRAGRSPRRRRAAADAIGRAAAEVRPRLAVLATPGAGRAPPAHPG